MELWPEEKTEMTKALWAEGVSAKEIARRLIDAGYSATRNSVIGKVHRLRLGRSVRWVAPVVEAPELAPPIISQAPNDPIRRMVNRKKQTQLYELHNGHRRGEMDVDKSGNVLLLDTKDGQCRAILGYKDDDKSQAICCGTQTPWLVTDNRRRRSPWCEHHREKYLTDRGKKEL